VETQARSYGLTRDSGERANAGIAKLAKEREHAERFEKFGTWLETNGPLDVFVDGANVGMYGMNFEKAEFSFKQLDTLMSYLQTRKRAEGYKVSFPPTHSLTHGARGPRTLRICVNRVNVLKRPLSGALKGFLGR